MRGKGRLTMAAREGSGVQQKGKKKKLGEGWATENTSP